MTGGSQIPVSIRDHSFSKHPLNKDFIPKWHPKTKILACMRFSQNLTPKGGFAQKFTTKSHRIPEKSTLFLKNGCLWYPKHDIRVSPPPTAPKQVPLFPVFLVTHATVLYLTAPLGFGVNFGVPWHKVWL